MNLLVTGATGLTGNLFMERLSKANIVDQVDCVVRATSDRSYLQTLGLNIHYYTGDTSLSQTWDEIFSQKHYETIIHIASIRHIPVILKSLKSFQKITRLILVGTTGVYSNYNQYSKAYKSIEKQLEDYEGSYCLLRPTMIYGSERDKNLHKLIQFCHRYGFFPVFGSGNCLLQPIHADDLAQAIISAVQRPNIQGAYDLSGGSIVTFRELLGLVSQLIHKPVRLVSLPLNVGVSLASLLEGVLGKHSPVRREQILRLQEDKAYSHEAAQRDLDFFPRSLKIGLQQEVDLLYSKGLISS